MSGTSPLLILFRNCLSPIFWLLYLENGISVFFRFFKVGIVTDITIDAPAAVRKNRELWGASPTVTSVVAVTTGVLAFRYPPVSVCSHFVCVCVQLYHP